MFRGLLLCAAAAAAALATTSDASAGIFRRHSHCYTYYTYPVYYAYGPCGCYAVTGPVATNTDAPNVTDTGKLSMNGTDDQTTEDPVTPEEQKWFDDLAKDKVGEEKASFDKFWKSMTHKERKEFHDEIAAERSKGKPGGE